MAYLNATQTRRRAKGFEISERRMRLVELAKAGKTLLEMAEAEGLSVRQVSKDLSIAKDMLIERTLVGVEEMREQKVKDHEAVIQAAWDGFAGDPKPGWLTVIMRNHEQISKLQGLYSAVEHNVNVTPPELVAWKLQASERLALAAASEIEFYDDDEANTIDGEVRVVEPGGE